VYGLDELLSNGQDRAVPNVRTVSHHDLRVLLHAWTAGDADARDQLMAVVYRQLRNRAAGQLRPRTPRPLVVGDRVMHEANIPLVDHRRVVWQERGQFFSVPDDTVPPGRSRAPDGQATRPVGPGHAR
jgi:ECF sigma factor